MKFASKTWVTVFVAILSLPLLSFADDAQKMNINTASVAELTTIKGIGQNKAAAIVTYRQEHGDFTSVEALDHVPGFGQKNLEKIESALTVGESVK